MDNVEEGISVIVSKMGGIEINVCTKQEHVDECRSLKSVDRYQAADFLPLKKLGLRQEFYK